MFQVSWKRNVPTKRTTVTIRGGRTGHAHRAETFAPCSCGADGGRNGGSYNNRPPSGSWDARWRLRTRTDTAAMTCLFNLFTPPPRRGRGSQPAGPPFSSSSSSPCSSRPCPLPLLPSRSNTEPQRPPRASHAVSLHQLHHMSSNTPGIWPARVFPCAKYMVGCGGNACEILITTFFSAKV